MQTATIHKFVRPIDQIEYSRLVNSIDRIRELLPRLADDSPYKEAELLRLKALETRLAVSVARG